jgi:glycosidase
MPRPGNSQSGIDGFRLDAVKHIEDSWISDLRNRLETDIESVSQQHFYTVGETFTGDRDLIKYYVDPANKLSGQFDFPMRVILTSTVLIRNQPMSDLANFFVSNDGFYGAGIMSTFIGNHDVPRSIHFAQDNKPSADWNNPWHGGNNGTENWTNTPSLPGEISAFERLGNAFSILYTSKGVPLVYYGDEIGLPGAGDPDNRRMMQWMGYSAGQNKLLAHLKALGKIRADHVALRRGSRTVLSSNADTIAYKMDGGGDSVVVLVNRADSQQSVGNIPAGAYTDLLTNATQNGPTITVPARSSMILVLK